MRGFIFSVFFVLIAWPQLATTQSAISPEVATHHLKTEQQSFLNYINSISTDVSIVTRIVRFVMEEADSIQKVIRKDPALSDNDKVKAIRSLASLMDGITENLALSKAELYDIPGAIESYKQLLPALLHHQPYHSFLEPISARRSQLLANTFRQFSQHKVLNDVATFKRVASAPDFILQYLESNPGFRFADSLLLFTAAYDPVRLSNYLKRSNSSLTNVIRNNPNIYIRQIVTLSKHHNAAELLPFVAPLAEGKMTVEGILKKRLDVRVYFQLLVNTLREYISMPDAASKPFHQALRNGIREKSLAFYVNRINELHDATNEVRFAAVKDLRAEDLYYVITSSEEELYTSSYLGLYSRLMVFCKKQTTDSLFRLVNYDNFRVFVRMSANYNTLPDLLGCLPGDTGKELLERFIGGIETDTHTGLEKAMDVADAFLGVGEEPELASLIRKELEANLARCRSSNHLFGARVYDILLQVYELMRDKDAANKLLAHLGDYEKLDRKSMQNPKGEIVEVVLFYGDKDGEASFNNFRNHYSDSSKWETTQNNSWIRIKSLSNEPLLIYANRPLDHEEEWDLKAQDLLFSHLRQNSLEPSILIHRGHSYHLRHTLKRMQSYTRLAILGSCGGYNNILSIANISPNAQMIVSKKIGSKFINDPMIDLINQRLTEKKDLVWADLWKELQTRFSQDKFTHHLFTEYIPPPKNLSLFVLKLFKYPKKLFIEDVVR